MSPMEIELFEIRDHLFSHPPFRNLPREVVDDLVSHIEVAYYQAGTMILERGLENHYLFFIRSGAVEILRSSGELYTQMGEGECFGQFSLLRQKKVRYAARAIEDTLIYKIPDAQFQTLAGTYDRFADFMEEEQSIRLKNALGRAGQEVRNPLMISKIDKLIHREIVTASPEVSIQQAAAIMTENRVSSLILVTDHPEPDRSPVVGLITDRDLRKRVIAKGLPVSSPVAEVMTTDIITLQAGEYAFEAMLTMMRHNLHHLPVLDGTRPVGVITVADLVRYESHGSVYLVGDIFRQKDVAGLAAMAPKIKQLFVHLVNEDANSHTIGAAISRMGISISQRLLQLGEKQLGPPPIPYCLLALGSMARDEMTIVTDQDNAFVLDDAFDPDRHDPYFKALARFLSDGLDQCGYPYCTGDIMATNAQWRQPLSAWKTCFSDWIDRPEPEALLHASIFFDLEGIFGETGFAGQLKQLIRDKARASPRFLACLARNALLRKPPLGFFRKFVLEHDGKHHNTFNLKRRGTAPISDLARVHALACGADPINTRDRLIRVKETTLLAEGVGDDLLDALELISMVRIRHQARQAESDIPVDNNVPPEHLSSFERNHLKDAFQVVSQAQSFLKYRYNVSPGMQPGIGSKPA
jgi:CBS domain-containing protein